MASKADRLASGLINKTNMSKAEVLGSTKAKLQSLIDDGNVIRQEIRLESIILNPNNDYSEKDTPAEIQKLADDISRNGLLHNIVVSLQDNGSYLLLSGERRYKAYKLLQEQTKNPQYDTIFALIKKGLDGLGEEIILDAANLQVRGGLYSSESRIRKSTSRFVNNLKTKFNISEEEAILLTVDITDVSEKSIKNNLNIEATFNKGLTALLDDKKISKGVVLSLAKLSDEEQEEVYNSFVAVLDEPAELKEKIDELSEALKNRDQQAIEEKKRLIREGQGGATVVVPSVISPIVRSSTKIYTTESQLLKANRDFKKIAYTISEIEDFTDLKDLPESVKHSVKNTINGLSKKLQTLFELLE